MPLLPTSRSGDGDFFPKQQEKHKQAVRELAFSEHPPFSSKVPASNTHDLPIRTKLSRRASHHAEHHQRQKSDLRELAKENMKLPDRDPYVLNVSYGTLTEQSRPTISGTLRLEGVDAGPDHGPNACLPNFEGMLWDKGGAARTRVSTRNSG